MNNKPWISRFLVTIALVLIGMSPSVADQILPSPVYADYNTFLGQVNILELVSIGTRDIEVKVSVYRLDGVKITTVSDTLPAGEQKDYIVNDLIGNQANTYGVVEIEFNAGLTNTKLIGRMSYYLPDESSEDSEEAPYSFVFSRQLKAPSTGATWAISNSYDPQDRNYIVPNWLQITNLSSSTSGFTVNFYNQMGDVLSSETVSLAAKQRKDFPAGHELGEVVLLAEVVPEDSAIEYISALSRYASNQRPGTNPATFSFAVSLDTRVGAVSDLTALITDRETSVYRQTNWVEVANVSSSSVSGTLTFFNNTGTQMEKVIYTFPPKAQRHFYANSILDDGTFGSVLIESDTPGSLIAQSSTYYHDKRENTVQTAYTLPAETPITNPITGSYNRFLNMQNTLYVINTSSETKRTDTVVRSSGTELVSERVSFSSLHTSSLNLNDEGRFGTSEDTYGTVQLDSFKTSSLVAYILREREGDDGSMDFANPTVFR